MSFAFCIPSFPVIHSYFYPQSPLIYQLHNYNLFHCYTTFSFFFSRLDLVPINRSVGLKAKPTKPVAEVLRPVVAKYGLHLANLVARIVSPYSLR